MNKKAKLYTLLLITMTYCIKGNKNPKPVVKKLISFYYHSSLLSQALIRSEGTEIKNSGRYTLDKNVNIKTTPKNEPIKVAGKEKTDGLLHINANNVTIDLNNKTIGCTTHEDRPTAIYIADNVSNVVIKNGSIVGSGNNKGFATAIHIGQNVSNITIENLKICNCYGPHGAIKIEGAKNNISNNIQIRNSHFSKCSHNIFSTIISTHYAHNVKLEACTIESNSTTESGSSSIIEFHNCNTVSGEKINIKNNNSNNNSTGININQSEHIRLKNIEFYKNNSEKKSSYVGINVNKTNDLHIHKVSMQHVTNLTHGILLHRSSHINLNYINLKNCSNTVDSLSGITLQGVDDATIKHVNINTNTSKKSFRGIISEDTKDNLECTLNNFDNIQITNNSSQTESFTGIAIKGTQDIKITDADITNNKTNNPEGKNVHGIYAIPRTKNSKDIMIKDCKITYNSSHDKATAAHSMVAGIYLKNVELCSITNTTSSHQSGNAQCFGVYAEQVTFFEMNNSNANHNVAGKHIAGTELLPSAGLFLYTSSGAQVKNCKFMHNKAGNKNPGNAEGIPMITPASSVIDVTRSCSGHGIANVGISPSTPNKNNTFIKCICLGNGTQADKLANNNGNPALAPQYQGTGTTRRCWESELFASGATEQNSEATIYRNCEFEKNGLYNHVTGYGLCIANDGVTSICKNVSITDCEAKNNNFYGFFDGYPSHTISFILGSLSVTNGVQNPIAEAVESDDHARNFMVTKESDVPYINISELDRVLMDPQKIELINLSVSL